MKVIYPGPNVTGEARTIPVYYGAHGVGLRPGENEIPDEAAAALLAAGHVTKPEDAPAEAPRPSEFVRGRGRGRSADARVAEPPLGTEE